MLIRIAVVVLFPLAFLLLLAQCSGEPDASADPQVRNTGAA